ncbi:MAG: hypothetical protein JNJ80_16960 [Gemmatimonadetes bacterium]|nr:hypothetical protein [Gemmatimonadota bacterium]
MAGLDGTRRDLTRGLLVVLGLAVAVAAAWYAVRFPEASAVGECRTRYAAAASARDTLGVDALVPSNNRSQIVQAADCGTRRRLGQLK